MTPFIYDSTRLENEYIRGLSKGVVSDLLSSMPTTDKSKSANSSLLRSDIVALSSMLDGEQIDRPLGYFNEHDRKLCFLTCLSTILNIGDDNSPVPQSAHAVTGQIHPDTIECVVCVENTGQKNDPSPIFPACRLEEVKGIHDSVRGAKLLETWDEGIDDDLNKRNYTMKEHLRDVFQILSYLSTCSPDDLSPRMIQFSLLIHRRAFRKIGWRIHDFRASSRWGRSLFLIMRDAIKQCETVKPSPEYSIKLEPEDFGILNSAGFPCFGEPPKETNSMALRKVQVNSQNIGDWIDGFVEYFHEIQKLFPPPENTSGPIPTGEQISMGILHIRCLNKLKPVIQFIVQIPEVILALYRSDSQRADKLSMTSENAQFVKSFKFESHVNHARQKLASKDVQGYPSVVQDKTENEGEEADYEQEDKDKVENEVEGEKDDLFPVALLGLSGLLQPMYAITAWFISVRYLSTQARRLLSGREPRVNLLRCPEVQPTKHDNQLVRVEFENLFSDLRMLASEKQLQTLAARCSKAKIHAEAALMARVYCNDSPHKLLGEHVAIAASKECCYLCWLLHRKLNKRKLVNGRRDLKPKFSLPGTRNQIHAWTPPLEVPEEILVKLRKEMIAIAQEVVRRYQ
ncbi:hypothetical protein C8R42DRAFT_777008 [Lentinula raphanica]|nr:hypothetical protein C8R42DRAFT_777008 [Lentinula raphanica]